MAKKPRRTKKADPSKFAKGAKVEGLDNVARLAASAAAATKGIGDNSSGITDDELHRQIDKILEAKADVDKIQTSLDKAKGVLRNAYKVAKDKGAPIDDVRAWVQLKRLSQGEVVTSHRNIGRIMRVMGDPLGTQYNLFSVPADEPGEEGKPKSAHPAMDAELQGQHAYRNNEPRTNNPFTQGTEEFVAWDGGWNNAMNANIRSMGPKGANGVGKGAEPAAS